MVRMMCRLACQAGGRKVSIVVVAMMNGRSEKGLTVTPRRALMESLSSSRFGEKSVSTASLPAVTF